MILRPPKSPIAGWFITPTIKEIKEALSLIKVDIGMAHINSGQYEIFQGASQFNALEMIDPLITPMDGVERYMDDNTQGPRMALSCAPGTLVRNYYISNEFGKQFNSLEKLDINHINGYLLWEDDPETLRKLSSKINHKI